MPATDTAATTLQVWASKQVTGYSHKPTVDVPILATVHHCADTTCGKAVEYVITAKWDGKWMHADGSTGHYVRPVDWCLYCGVEHGQDGAVVKFDQSNAWVDQTTCSRCGGITGRALGD